MIVSAGPKWAWLEKKYLYSDWTSDDNIWMEDGQGGDLFACKRIKYLYFFLTSYKLLKTAQLLSYSS